MTIEEAKDGVSAAWEGWLAKALITTVLTLTVTIGTWALHTLWETAQGEQVLAGKFDTLTSTIAAFQNQVAAVAVSNSAQDRRISDLTSVVTRLEQAVIDHVEAESNLVIPSTRPPRPRAN